MGFCLESILFVEMDRIIAVNHFYINLIDVVFGKSFHRPVQPAMPKNVTVLITIELEYIAHIVARARARIRVGAVLVLELRIDLFINNRQSDFMLYFSNLLNLASLSYL